MHPDFHCHSYYSDGQHSPDFLITRARANGITHLSITDHDFITWDSWEDSQALDLQLIPGVEISCQWDGREVHIVGLCVSPNDSHLQDLLSTQRQIRESRIRTMDLKLEQLGIHGLVSHLESLPCKSWTRSHVAEFLVTNGHSKNWQKAFKRFLSRKGKIYEPFECVQLADATSAINQAGGIGILAHPGRYGFSKSRLNRLVQDFIACGGQALEGSYGNIEPAMRKHLGELAARYGLYISIGSDFHDASRHWNDLGKAPPLDTAATKNAIWNHPRWHF